MKPIKFRVWWSPIGAPYGERIIKAADLSDALKVAFEEMCRHSDMGGYGASPIGLP
jgi:hypothetical protein